VLKYADNTVVDNTVCLRIIRIVMDLLLKEYLTSGMINVHLQWVIYLEEM